MLSIFYAVNFIYKKLMWVHNITVMLWRKREHSWGLIRSVIYAVLFLAAVGLVIATITEASARFIAWRKDAAAYARMEMLRSQRSDEREKRKQERQRRWEERRRDKEKAEKAD